MKKNRTRKKERHWCLTLFLAVIFFSSFCKIFSPYLNVFYGKQNLLLSLLSFCHCVSVIAIFKWNKRGFWVFAITACLHILLNFYYFDHTYPAFMEIFRPNVVDYDWFTHVFVWIISSLGGLIGLVSLYALLQIGGNKKAWTQLEEHQYVEK